MKGTVIIYWEKSSFPFVRDVWIPGAAPEHPEKHSYQLQGVVWRDTRTPTRHRTQWHRGSLHTQESLNIKSALLLRNKLEKTKLSELLLLN